jgi:quercetin dioxygenase-like cupin family protein
MATIPRLSALVTAVGLLVFSTATLAEQAPKPEPQAAKPAAKPAAPAAQAAAPKHVLLTPDQLKWGPAPESLPAGAQMAVVDGDPAVAGKPFAIRAKFPAGYRVPPHWHPADENVVVISGALALGMGDKMDEASMHTLPPGGYAKMPRQMHHYALSKGETVIQVYGMGPFGVTYVNPKDDPRKATK